MALFSLFTKLCYNSNQAGLVTGAFIVIYTCVIKMLYTFRKVLFYLYIFPITVTSSVSSSSKDSQKFSSSYTKKCILHAFEHGGHRALEPLKTLEFPLNLFDP